MLEYSSIHFFILFNKQYKCIYSKWVLDAVSYTGIGTGALIQQGHSMGNQDQKKKSLMSLKSKGDFEHTGTDNARKPWSESPSPQCF